MRGPHRAVRAVLTASVLFLTCQFVRAQASRPAADTQPTQESNQFSSWASTPAETTAADKKDEAKQSGWLSVGTTLVGVEGSDQEFRQQKQIDDDMIYGVRSAGYTWQKDGWLADINGRAMQPWDYGADVAVKKSGIGFIEGTFNEFPSYYNSTRDFYPFKPNVYSVSRNLVTTRMDSNVRGGWYVDKDTTLQVRTDYWEKNGDFPTLAGGQVTNKPPGVTTLKRYPDFTDVDQHRERIGSDLVRKLGRFELKLSFDATDFDGTNEVLRGSYLSSGKLSSMADYKFTPAFNELTPKIELSGDLIENVLRVEYEGTYGWTRSTSGFARHNFDANGLVTGTALVNNWSDVTENETSHDLRLLYTPTDRVKIYGGTGFKYVAQDGDSVLNTFGTTKPAHYTLIDQFDTADTREIWMGNVGGEVKVLDWLTASTDARWEHGDLQRDWSGKESNLPSGKQTTSAKNNFHWILDEPSDRYEYGAALAAKPTRDVKIVLRWQETRINNDYDTDVLTNNKVPFNPASPLPSELRALVGDNSRINDEWSILTQYKPSSNFEVTYKLAAKTNSYLVSQNDPKPENAGVNDLSNNLRVTFRPVDKLTISVYGAVDDYDVLTSGRPKVDPNYPVPAYGDSFITWGIEPSVELTSWFTLNGGFCQRWGDGGAMAENANDIYPYRALDTYIGAVFKINKNWSADCRYTFSWFDEAANADLNNFSGSTFTVGATARF